MMPLCDAGLHHYAFLAASAERENLTAFHEYREAVLVISRKHLLKALKVLCLSFRLAFTAH